MDRAIPRHEGGKPMIVYAVGIGPGDLEHITPQARQVIDACDVIVGYTLYIDLVAGLLHEKKIIATGMKSEVARCKMALAEAKNVKKVAVISSGDAGIYGMAALLLELSENTLYKGIEIEIVPGITAATAAASLLGAPLSNDFAVISLSDLLTPWPVIERRLEAAGLGDFVVCLYNPRSKTRKDGLRRACDILLRHKSPQTPCGYVRNALRGNGERKICTLSDLPDAEIDMLTTVIVGNSATRWMGNRLVTSRGYRAEEANQ
jgi:precorrin-3B C17-methyltransferase